MVADKMSPIKGQKDPQNKRSELQAMIQILEEDRLMLIGKQAKLEQELLEVKNRYQKEKRLAEKSKKELEKLYQSRSWRFSLPMRKIGRLFKKASSSKSTATLKRSNQTNHLATQASVRYLDRKLWAGYRAYALRELHALKDMREVDLNEKLRAARSLARYYYDRGEYQRALQEIQYIDEMKPLKNPNPDRIVTEIKILKKLGEIQLAKRKVWKTIRARGLLPELCLSMAHLSENDEDRLQWYNHLYEMYDINPLKKYDPSNPLSLENIQTNAKHRNRKLDNYKVSIIIPAYEAEESIHIPLRSLQQQTLKNIEIIVVDDCSSDGTARVVRNFARKDPRIRLIEKEKNEGAYVARNTGLKYVTGDFVTVHDSDDWSHAQKLELQLLELLKNPHAVGSISYLARVDEDVMPLNAGSLLGSKFLIMNSSSLLVRRNVLETLGGWDRVRVAGDSEFIWRIEKAFGRESIVSVLPELPLSLALSSDESLTGTSMTHVKTIMFGLRRIYRESFEWWQKQADSLQDLCLDLEERSRRFPAPVMNQINRIENRSYSIVLIADFSNPTSSERLTQIIQVIACHSKKLALFHWPDYREDPFLKIMDEIFEIIQTYKIDILVPGETVKTEEIVCLTPRIFDYPIDQHPFIQTAQAQMIEHGNISEAEKEKFEQNFKNVFPGAIQWVSIDSFLRDQTSE